MTEGDQHVGKTIAGKYQIRRLIGVGGMGAVYEGEHIELGKKVAVKILDAVADTSAELATRFRREARAASAVESDGIVQVFDVGRDPEIGLFMVMELLQGEDLEARLRKQPGRRLEPIVAAQIGHQVARALVKAHGARVIHRDLKPANIFLTDRDDGSLRVKILDFGISKLLASEGSVATNKEHLLELTAAGVALGTPQYMSPEQAQGLTTVDHRADVWGLGVVLYEALAGVPAFPELRTYQETLINLLQNSPQPLVKVAPWVPEGLAQVVHQALRHEVEERFQDCETFAARLAAEFPDIALAATGGFNATKQLRQASSPSHAAYPSPSAPAAFAALAPPFPPPRTASPARPTAIDDTQVVVRTSHPEAEFNDGDLSTTMLADSVRSPDGAVANVQVRSRSNPGPRAGDDGPLSTGDPTMFQTPAWVESPPEGPATLKTGLSMPEVLTAAPRRRATQAVSAALTAVIVVVVGGGVLFGLLLASRSGERSSSASAGTTSAIEEPSVAAVTVTPPPSEPPVLSAGDTPDPSSESPGTAPSAPSAPVTPPLPAAALSIAAPPATGTGAIPMAPVTGAVRVESAPPPPASIDASGTAAAAR
jgi:serine/threonine-protein kinase